MEEPKKIDLKPCPFCGGDAEIIEHEWKNDPDHYEVRCTNIDCDAIVATYGSTLEEAAEKWNRRANNEPNR